MTELFGNSEQVSEQFGNSEQLLYIPTTEEVRLDYAPIKTFPADAEKQFDRWLAEVKAEAWDEGFSKGVNFFNAGDVPNPYRQGEGSGNGASQSPIESDNLLNGEEQ